MKRLTGTRSSMSPCQDTGADEVSPSISPDPSAPMNNAGELPVAILMAGEGSEALCVDKCFCMCVCMNVSVCTVIADVSVVCTCVYGVRSC